MAAPMFTFTPGWATFGLALPDGFGDAVQVGDRPTQTDVKTVGKNGTRFAVVTARIPAAGAYPITAMPLHGGDLFDPAWPDVAVKITTGGTVFTAQLPAFTAVDPWLSGPLVRESRVMVAPKSVGIEHPLLQVVFDIRSYLTGESRVDVTIQNCRDIAALNEVRYDLTITTDGVTRTTKGGVQQKSGTRARMVFAGAGLIEAEITPDFTPYYESGMLPRFVANLPAPNLLPVGPTFDILGYGSCQPYMGGPGGREELAPYPSWTAKYLSHPTQALRAYVLAHGNCAGSWSSHYLKPDGKTLIRLDAQPDYWLDSRNLPPNGPANNFVGSGNQIEAPHVPSLSYVPYVVTGDRFHLDELKMWANALLLMTYSGDAHNFSTPFIDSNRKGAQALLAPYAIQQRGFGWGLRDVVDAAIACPDADPDKAYFAGSVQRNLTWLDTYAKAVDDGGFLHPLFADFDPGYGMHDGYASISLWQQAYLTWAVDHAALNGFGPTKTFRDRAVTTMVQLLTDAELPPSWGASVWYPRVATRVNGVQTPFRTMREFMSHNYERGRDTLDGNGPGDVQVVGGQYRMLALMGARDGIPKAAQALAYLEGAGVLGTVNSGYALARFDGSAVIDPPTLPPPTPPVPPPPVTPLPPAPIIVRWTVRTAQPEDPDHANNTSALTINPLPALPPVPIVAETADVVAEKPTCDNPTPRPGEMVTYSFVLRNNGPAKARDLSTTIELPLTRLRIISATSPTLGGFNQTTLVWTPGVELAASDVLTLTVKTQFIA